MSRNKRRTQSPPFVMMPHWVLRSPAWRALLPDARAVYLELKSRFNGANNGMIGLGAREAAEAINVGRNVANRALRELEAAGFIEAAVKGSFRQNGRRATDWLLTELPDDRTGHQALKTFMSRKIVSPASGTVSPMGGTQRPKAGSKPFLRLTSGTETPKPADLASRQRDTSRSTTPPVAEAAQDATEEAPPSQGARTPEERTSGKDGTQDEAPAVSSSLLTSKLIKQTLASAPRRVAANSGLSDALRAKLVGARQ